MAARRRCKQLCFSLVLERQTELEKGNRKTKCNNRDRETDSDDRTENLPVSLCYCSIPSSGEADEKNTEQTTENAGAAVPPKDPERRTREELTEEECMRYERGRICVRARTGSCK